MRSRLILQAGSVLLAIVLVRASARAQDVTVPIPGGYTAPDAAPASREIPDPAASLRDDGSTVLVPIPGGGQVQVDGPASEAPQGIGPTENWSIQRNNPFSVGTGPAGPIPPPQ